MYSKFASISMVVTNLIIAELLEVYGPCISTASWAEWPRHRKVLATPFNESIMKFVWHEALGQAKGMLDLWTDHTRGTIQSAKDTRTLSLNVLAATGFRKSYEFSNSIQADTSYRDALQTVLDNAILLMLVAPRFLRLPFMPSSWEKVGRAAAEFKTHMQIMLSEETRLFEEGKAGSGTLMTSFVRALGVHQKEEARTEKVQQVSKGLTVDEIFGNIFVINFAGHDTTANTLAFAMILLAAYPDIQEWVAEEVKKVADSSSETWAYEKVFEKLKRCRAVLVSDIPDVLLSLTMAGSLKLFASSHLLWPCQGGAMTSHKIFALGTEQLLYHRTLESCPASLLFKCTPCTGMNLLFGIRSVGYPNRHSTLKRLLHHAKTHFFLGLMVRRTVLGRGSHR